MSTRSTRAHRRFWPHQIFNYFKFWSRKQKCRRIWERLQGWWKALQSLHFIVMYDYVQILINMETDTTVLVIRNTVMHVPEPGARSKLNLDLCRISKWNAMGSSTGSYLRTAENLGGLDIDHDIQHLSLPLRHVQDALLLGTMTQLEPVLTGTLRIRIKASIVLE